MVFLWLLYESALKEFTTSDKTGSAKYWQSKLPSSTYHFLDFVTKFGGGNEIAITCGISFLFWSRSRTFYYLALFGLEKMIMAYLKLILNDPRPYMADSELKNTTCSTGMGAPSGHSSASWSFAIVFFLDIFHGSSIPLFQEAKPKNCCLYLIALLFCLTWMSIIPFSRYV